MRLPSVDTVLRTPTGTLMVCRFGHSAAVAAIRNILAATRAATQSGAHPAAEAAPIAAQALHALEQGETSSLRRVFNLTGTVLHTNLGRAAAAGERYHGRGQCHALASRTRVRREWGAAR